VFLLGINNKKYHSLRFISVDDAGLNVAFKHNGSSAGFHQIKKIVGNNKHISIPTIS